jgi:hypothetical protein
MTPELPLALLALGLVCLAVMVRPVTRRPTLPERRDDVLTFTRARPSKGER